MVGEPERIVAMQIRTLSTRAFATVLPVALLLFGLGTWFSYESAREREIRSSTQLLGQDRRLAQQELDSRFDELALAHRRARGRVVDYLNRGRPPLTGFDRYFLAQPDGTRRSADSLWDGMTTELGDAAGFGAYIAPGTMAPERRRGLSAAFASMVGLVDGLPTNVNNLYFFTPDNDLIMHAPAREDRLAFYRSDAPATLDFQNEEFSRIVSQTENPHSVMRCTSLQPILYDATRQTWTTGCMTPVRMNGRQVGAFGSSIPLDEIFVDDTAAPTPGVDRIIVTMDGMLVRHPHYTIQNTRRTGEFLDLKRTDKQELRELWAALRSTADRPFAGYLPVSDAYVDAQRLAGPGWYVVSIMPGEVVRDRAFASARPILLAGLLVTAAFGLFLVMFVRRQLIKPIARLAERADLVSLGSERFDDDGPEPEDELGRLNRAFDAMESRVAKERLRLTRSFDQLVDAIEEYAILLLDPTGMVTRANKAAKEHFGWEEGRALSQIWTDQAAASSESESLLIDAAAQAGFSQSVRRMRADGTGFWAFEALEPIRDGQDLLVGFAYIARDVTTQKDAETAILEARDKATREAEMRRDLLATMSHEIRTPMTGILGMLEEVRRGNSARTRDRALASIENSAEALMRVLDDVLDHAKAESGALSIEQRDFDTSRLLQNAAELFLPLARKKGLAIDLRTGPREQLIGDPGRIQQILANFLSNAIKFTDSGTITLACTTTSAGEGLVDLTLRVSDTGMGIPGDRVEALFAPYEQADATTQRRFGGTGLGLAICRKLAQAMGGDVQASSEVGAGSSFALHLVLPRAKTNMQALPGQGKHALVLLRSATHALSAQAALEELGFGVVIATSAAQIPAQQPFAAILCDADMAVPGALPTALHAVPLIRVGGDRAAAGGHAVLGVPVTQAGLQAALSEAVA